MKKGLAILNITLVVLLICIMLFYVKIIEKDSEINILKGRLDSSYKDMNYLIERCYIKAEYSNHTHYMKYFYKMENGLFVFYEFYEDSAENSTKTESEEKQ